MKHSIALLLVAGCLAALAACGGGGGSGGSLASGTAPGSGGGTKPPVAYAQAEQIVPYITSASVPDDGRVVIEFRLLDQDDAPIVDLTAGDISLTLAKLRQGVVGNLTGTWQSYINRIEQPGVGPGTEPKLQATSESGGNGEFTNHGGGSYRYRFAASVKSIDDTLLAQARDEGLDLSYEPRVSHRVGMQFRNSREPANPVYDWVPATGAVDYIFHQDIAATTNCNRCHVKLALHGGSRVEVQYCVTCHNAGTTDANSGNTVDMKVMIHKIHMGEDLPSVVAGEPYIIYGNRDRAYDFSTVAYPNNILNCVNCHVGTASDPGDGSLQLTAQGDNWNQYATAAACGSCHDRVDVSGELLTEDAFFAQHYGGQPTDLNCMSCHGIGGVAGPVADSHVDKDPVEQARGLIAAEILAVEQTLPGEFPRVTFRVFNPTDGSNYDILTDPVWQNGSLSVKIGWSTTDYTNVGNQGSSASTLSMDARSTATRVGDGSFAVTFDKPIPDAGIAPGIPASGSGAAVIEGRASYDVNGDGNSDRVPLTNVVSFFPITDNQAVARRQSVDLDRCQVCHEHVEFHGGSRSDNIDSCVTCHNPRYTKSGGGSVNFKPLIHAKHREVFPSMISNCLACHTDTGHQLPLPAGVLATTISAGADAADPRDDTVVTPIASACSSCHDGDTAKAHMVNPGGGSFATTQAAIDSGDVVEQCDICHGAGRANDADKYHRPVAP